MYVDLYNGRRMVVVSFVWPSDTEMTVFRLQFV